jgi:hypothetical protein
MKVCALIFAPLVRSSIYTHDRGGWLMAMVLKHRKVKIVVLERNEAIAAHCRDGDIAIVVDGAGWWIKFVGADGHLDCYGAPYPSYNEALWTAKAAAEFGT